MMMLGRPNEGINGHPQQVFRVPPTIYALHVRSASQVKAHSEVFKCCQSSNKVNLHLSISTLLRIAQKCVSREKCCHQDSYCYIQHKMVPKGETTTVQQARTMSVQFAETSIPPHQDHILVKWRGVLTSSIAPEDESSNYGHSPSR